MRNSPRSRSKNWLSTMPWRSGQVPVASETWPGKVLDGKTGHEPLRARALALHARERAARHALGDSRGARRPRRAGSRVGSARAASDAQRASASARSALTPQSAPPRAGWRAPTAACSISPARAWRSSSAKRHEHDLDLLGRLARDPAVGEQIGREEHLEVLVADAGAAVEAPERLQRARRGSRSPPRARGARRRRRARRRDRPTGTRASSRSSV